MKVIYLVFGILFSMIGLLGIFFGLLSIYDPIGAMLADDHNPFAKPPTISESLWVTALYLVVLLAGILLLLGPILKKKIGLNQRLHRIADKSGSR
jgi:hypothetical protein